MPFSDGTWNKIHVMLRFLYSLETQSYLNLNMPWRLSMSMLVLVTHSNLHPHYTHSHPWMVLCFVRLLLAPPFPILRGQEVWQYQHIAILKGKIWCLMNVAPTYPGKIRLLAKKTSIYATFSYFSKKIVMKCHEVTTPVYYTALWHHIAYSSPIKCCCATSTWMGDPVSVEMFVSDCV